MFQPSQYLSDAARWWLATALFVTTGRAAGTVAVVQPPFSDHYTLIDLGAVPGVGTPYGGITFPPGVTNAILIGGFAGGERGALFEAGLMRDATHSIAGFAGTTGVFAEAYAIDGGLAYAPDDVLFYTRVTWEMGEIKPESSRTDKVVDLRALYWRPGGLNFVPPGFGGAGRLKLTTWAYGDWWTIDIAPDETGTYHVAGMRKGPSLPGNPEGFVYVPAGAPGFANPGLIVCECANSPGSGNLSAYDVDDHGDPILATRRVIVSGLDVPESVTIDPVTGDVVFASRVGKLHLLRQAPLPPTTSTRPPACGVEPGFQRIAGDVAALLALVRGASELGSLQATFVARLERAQATAADGQRAAARDGLGRLRRQMLLLRAQTRTLRARKTIPKALAQRIGDAAREIAADAHALRGALDCS